MGRGGSESNVMWLIEALKRDCDVTVVTTGGWDLAALNKFYGTQVREDEVKVRIAPVPILARNMTAVALRGSCYQRFALQIADQYDVRISAYNATDWGLPAVHFIADFCWHRHTPGADPSDHARFHLPRLPVSKIVSSNRHSLRNTVRPGCAPG